MDSVSVIIPTYNRAELLPATIDSIVSQTYPIEQIIVIDDGSTDDTEAVARQLPSKVQYHRQDNGGVCAARNLGAKLAKSRFLAFCDGDDLWRADKLALQMQLHEQVPSLQYSFTNFSIIKDDIWSSSSKFDDAPPGFFEGCESIDDSSLIAQTSMYERILRFQPIWPSTVLITAELFRDLRGFNETFGRNPSEDLEFTLRCLSTGPIGIISTPCVGIRKHSSNFSGSSYRNTLGQIEILKYVLSHHPISDSTRAAVSASIDARRIDAGSGAFALKEFDRCRDLLHGIPDFRLTWNLRAKRLISKCPKSIANVMHSILSKA